ncbi:MAG: hypothetical protein MOGMAGMI_02646 [Candidatus Omnitrophica bacterium]|nr:hypothetical protein [Candidatus Omnitrophota bacterium]
MNFKMLATQLQLLPEGAVYRHVNGVLYPLRRAMLIEATREVPNTELIQTCKGLEKALVDGLNAERIHTLDSTALFVFQADEDKRSDIERRNAARTTLMRRVANKQVAQPRSKAELDRMIDLELQRAHDRVAENFGKAIDAVEFVQTLPDDTEYDEASLPEYVSEAFVGKLIDAGIDTFRDAHRRLLKAKLPFQETGPRAAKEGALNLLRHFNVTENDILSYEEKAAAEAKALFDRLDAEEPVPTIDEPPADTPKAKRERRRVEKAKSMGITSADMAAAASVK